MKKIIMAMLSLACALTATAKSGDGNAKIRHEEPTVELEDGGFVQDRKDFEYGRDTVVSSIPKKYEGEDITVPKSLTGVRSPPIHIKVKRAGLVTILVDENAYKELHEQGWEYKEDEHAIFTRRSDYGVKMYFMKKNFEVGEYDIPRGVRYGTRIVDM